MENTGLENKTAYEIAGMVKRHPGETLFGHDGFSPAPVVLQACDLVRPTPVLQLLDPV